jgi:hypothetical protein
MFKTEANMLDPVFDWMQSLNLSIKLEFITPWGMCDLVGMSFRKGSVARRRKLGQARAVTSMTRAALLHYIPDVNTHRSVTMEKLTKECAPIIPSRTIIQEAEKLIADGFVRLSKGKRLQKLNGWMPLHKRLIAVELKLNRVEEAMCQAANNLGFADESYVALPEDLAKRIVGKPDRRDRFLKSGVGILGVTRASCKILMRSRLSQSEPDPVVQFYCIEKFWQNALDAVEH